MMIKILIVSSLLGTLQGCSWVSSSECEYLTHHGVAKVLSISQSHADLQFQPSNISLTILRDDYPHLKLQPNTRYITVLNTASNDECSPKVQLISQIEMP